MDILKEIGVKRATYSDYVDLCYDSNLTPKSEESWNETQKIKAANQAFIEKEGRRERAYEAKYS